MLEKVKKSSNQADEEPDEWEERIKRGGCAEEHFKLQNCYSDTKDWRKCKIEVEPTNTNV
jgi:cytochrome c oxidase assembly factor 4